MQSSFAVNKYLHTVASIGFLFTLNYDARNHELKTSLYVVNEHKKCKCLTCVYVYSLQAITAVPNTRILSSNTNGLRVGAESRRIPVDGYMDQKHVKMYLREIHTKKKICWVAKISWV